MGDRNKTSIVEFVQQRTLPASVEVDCATMQQKSTQVEYSFGFFGALDSDLFETYMEGANHRLVEDNFEFFHTPDLNCVKEFGGN